MLSFRLAAAAVLLALPAAAQFTHVIPNGTANTEGSTSNAFPWGRGSSASLQIQTIYDSTHFTAASITYPILISRLRYRLNGGVNSTTGGTYTQATVEMASATVDAMSPGTNFAANMGTDRALVYSGPVVQQVAAASTPGPWFVDIPLTTPFVYDPSLGNDLVIFSDIPPGVGVGVPSLQMDVQGTGALASRVYNSTAYGSGSGTVTTNHGVVVELTYLPTSGAALALPYGEGCYAAAASFYEQFAPGTFDLSNTAIQMVPTGGGYAVVPSAPGLVTPTSANLALGNDVVSTARNLPFTFNYPGGSSSSLFISSNGYVWLQSNTAAGCCNGSSQLLLTQAVRYAPLWTDLNPAAGGSVHFDLDATNSAAYVTWLNVPENGLSNLNSVQLAFFSDGRVEYRYGSCAVATHTTVTGFSPGGNARDPGGVDLSAALPVITAADTWPLTLGASPRPVLGNTVVMSTSHIPAATPLGIVALSFQRFSPGISLAQLGAPGCYQNAGVLSTIVFLPSGTSGTISVGIPVNQALAGRHVYGQSLTLTAGLNALGLITSNGLDLLLNPL